MTFLFTTAALVLLSVALIVHALVYAFAVDIPTFQREADKSVSFIGVSGIEFLAGLPLFFAAALMSVNALEAERKARSSRGHAYGSPPSDVNPSKIRRFWSSL